MTSEMKTDDLKLTPEVKSEWCEALRSGKYKQGRGFLHDDNDNSYCCLGVLQALRKLPKDDEGDEYIDPPHAEIFGLKIGKQMDLAAMNDDGQSFAEIASYIEANL